MKNKKITAMLLAVVLLFSCMMPAYAVDAVQTADEPGQTGSFSVTEILKAFFHNLIEKVFTLFGLKCPFCGDDTVPAEKDEVVVKYNNGINSLKNYRGTVIVKKTDDVSVRIADLPSVTESIMSAVVESYTGVTENTYVFTQGKNVDGTKIGDKIEPCGRDASLLSAGVISTESTSTKTGGSKIKIVLAPEMSVYDGTSVTEEPVNNVSVISTVNYGALDLGPVVVHQAETTYTGTVLEAEYDSQGRLINLKITVPMDIYFTAKAAISVSGSAHADVITEYTINYVS